MFEVYLPNTGMSHSKGVGEIYLLPSEDKIDYPFLNIVNLISRRKKSRLCSWREDSTASFLIFKLVVFSLHIHLLSSWYLVNDSHIDAIVVVALQVGVLSGLQQGHQILTAV